MLAVVLSPSAADAEYWPASSLLMLMTLAGWVVLLSPFADDAAGARRLGSICNLHSY